LSASQSFLLVSLNSSDSLEKNPVLKKASFVLDR